MTPTLVIVVVAVIGAGVLLARLAGRPGRRDDVERFHRARTLTTAWADEYQRDGAPSPYPSEEEPEAAAEPVGAEAQGPIVRQGRPRNSAT